MTTFEQKILDELAALRSELAALRSDFTISQITFFENLPPSAVVGSDYVAYRFGIAENAVVRGRFETNRIRRVRNKPLAFIKREVDAVWHSLNQSADDLAARYRHNAVKGNNKVKI